MSFSLTIPSLSLPFSSTSTRYTLPPSHLRIIFPGNCISSTARAHYKEGATCCNLFKKLLVMHLPLPLPSIPLHPFLPSAHSATPPPFLTVSVMLLACFYTHYPDLTKPLACSCLGSRVLGVLIKWFWWKRRVERARERGSLAINECKQ